MGGGRERGRDGGRGGLMTGTSEEGTERGMVDARERGEGLGQEGREHGSKGGRETSREVVYSQTNLSQTGPCP